MQQNNRNIHNPQDEVRQNGYKSDVFSPRYITYIVSGFVICLVGVAMGVWITPWFALNGDTEIVVSDEVVVHDENTKQAHKDRIDTMQENGLTITSPVPEESVLLPVTVVGYVHDAKKWGIFEGEAGVVEVYGMQNGEEKRLGQRLLRLSNVAYDDEPPFYFEAIVGDRQWISNIDKKDGYLLFKENGAKDGEQIDTVTMPVVFDIPDEQVR